MHLASLDLASGYDHIYLAPHPDDAVLSCGGQIAQLCADGKKVLIVTICAASPSATAPLTTYAEHLHRTYGLGEDPMAGRRDEDVAAWEILGCDGLHLDQLDAPYRLDAYGTRGAVFGERVEDDPLGPATRKILDQLHQQQPSAQFYIPLGVGRHVDHQVVYAEGIAFNDAGAQVVWYEDAPYAVQPEAVAARFAELAEQFEARIVAIDGMLPRKLAAIAAYRSQVPKLFKDLPMEQVMTDYAAHVAGAQGGYAERVWLRSR